MMVLSPCHCQQVLLSIFLTLALLVQVKWYLTVVLICISVVTDDVEYLITFHLYILFGEMFLQLFCPVLIILFIFLLLHCKNSLHILDTKSLSDIWFTNIFFHSVYFLDNVMFLILMKLYYQLFFDCLHFKNHI